MRNRPLALALAVASILLLGLASCGDDDGGADDGTPSDDATEDTGGDTDDAGTDDGAAPGESTGSGTLTVGDDTFDFEVIFCGRGSEETGNTEALFSLAGRGEDGLQVDASTIQVSEEMGPMDSISAFSGDPTSPDVNWQGLHGPDGFQDTQFLEIDGDQVSATAMFFDESGEGDPAEEPVEGTFEATCP